MEVRQFFKSYWDNITPAEAWRIKRMSATVLLLSLIVGSVSSGLLGLLNNLINGVEKPGPMALWSFVGLVVILPLTRFSSSVATNRLMVPVHSDLIRNFMRKFAGLSVSEVESQGVSTYYAVVNEDLRVMNNALHSAVFVIMQIAVVTCCLIYLGWLSLPVLGYTVLFLLFGIILHRLVLLRAMKFLAIGRECYGKEVGYFGSIAHGIKELKLHQERRGAFFEQLVTPAFDTMNRNVLKGHNIFTAAQCFASMLYFLLMGTILFGSLWVFQVPNEVLSGYALTILFLLAPLEVVALHANTIFRARVSARKLVEVGLSLFSQAGSDELFKELQPLPEFRDIQFTGIKHHYGDPDEEPHPHDFVLGPVDLKLNPGEVIMVAGGNGSGKTTLAKVICGLYLPSSGTIKFNDMLVTKENIERYRQLFSVVFVDCHLFEHLLGYDHIPDLEDRARKLLKDMDIDDKLKIEDGKLSTTKLSEGQKKRLALVLAFLEDRPCYIFDEWTANQDPGFRDFFYTKIVPDLKKRNKSILIITHDEKYFHAGDRIIKMDMGKVALDMPSSSLRGQDLFQLDAFSSMPSEKSAEST